MKFITLFAIALTAVAAEPAQKPVASEKPAAAAPAEPTPEQKELASLKEQVGQLQKAVAVLKQQRDALAQQLLDVQAGQQMQSEAKK